MFLLNNATLLTFIFWHLIYRDITMYSCRINADLSSCSEDRMIMEGNTYDPIKCKIVNKQAQTAFFM